jgi:hypothetical protein
MLAGSLAAELFLAANKMHATMAASCQCCLHGVACAMLFCAVQTASMYLLLHVLKT